LKKNKLLLVTIFLLSNFAWADEISIEEGRVFFEKYQALDAAYDPAFIELYTDRSQIQTLRRYPHGLERKFQIPGAQWKLLLKKALPVAKARGDRSEYLNPRYEQKGNYLRIRATRYSILKCYNDEAFYLDIERGSNSVLYIKNMYLETQPESSC
jgi:hypothetical protein